MGVSDHLQRCVPRQDDGVYVGLGRNNLQYLLCTEHCTGLYYIFYIYMYNVYIIYTYNISHLPIISGFSQLVYLYGPKIWKP